MSDLKYPKMQNIYTMAMAMASLAKDFFKKPIFFDNGFKGSNRFCMRSGHPGSKRNPAKVKDYNRMRDRIAKMSRRRNWA